MDAENLSLPVSTVAELTDSALPWQPQPVTITSLADLRETAESYFSPDIVDKLFALSPDHYKDFDGVLYATDGGRGSNLYLLDKTVAAEQDGSYRLPDGTYTYTVRAKGYAKVSQTLEVSGDVTVPVTLEPSAAWDGQTVTAPEVGDGTEASPYEIENGEPMSSRAALTARVIRCPA